MTHTLDTGDHGSTIMAEDMPIPLAELKDPRHIEDARAAMRELIKRVPRRFGYADESGLLFDAAQACGKAKP